MVSGYPTFTSISRVNGLSTDPWVLGRHMNDLNALNRMLTVKFELRIDWYTNKGQISSTENVRNDVSLQSVAQLDSISIVHKLIFNNQSAAQRDSTVL